MRYRIQILDAQTDRIEYFDRMKTSYGGHRIITSLDKGKTYPSRESAEADALIVAKYFSGQHLIEIVESEQDESHNPLNDGSIDF